MRSTGAKSAEDGEPRPGRGSPSPVARLASRVLELVEAGGCLLRIVARGRDAVEIGVAGATVGAGRAATSSAAERADAAETVTATEAAPPPSAPRPPRPNWPSNSSIGWASDGASIVCSSLTSLTATENPRSTLSIGTGVAPSIAEGSMDTLKSSLRRMLSSSPL